MGTEAGKENYEAIQVGMTPEQVSSILFDDIDKLSRFREFDRDIAHVEG
jgi:hypothetical protein